MLMKKNKMEIPNEWKLNPLNYLASYNDESLGESTDPEYEFDYIEIGSVQYGQGITGVEHMKFENAPSRARRIVQANDIIISTVRTYLKAIATVSESENQQTARGERNLLRFFFPVIRKSVFFVVEQSHGKIL